MQKDAVIMQKDAVMMHFGLILFYYYVCDVSQIPIAM